MGIISICIACGVVANVYIDKQEWVEEYTGLEEDSTSIRHIHCTYSHTHHFHRCSKCNEIVTDCYQISFYSSYSDEEKKIGNDVLQGRHCDDCNDRFKCFTVRRSIIWNSKN